MFSRIIDYFRNEDDDDPAFIRLTRNIVISVILINALVLPLVTGKIGKGSQNPLAFIALTITLALELASLALIIFRKNPYMAKTVIPFGLIAAITAISLNTNGLKNAALLGLPIVLVISAILQGKRSMILTLPAAILATIVISIFDLSGGILFIPVGLDDAILVPILVMGSAIVTQLMLGRLNESIQRARVSEKIHREENIELNELRAMLEERVNQRTIELETANRYSLRRARQFEAIVQVNRAITSIHDLDTLLPRIAQVISEQFKIYHTGIFLLDENREYAVLRAASSEGGKKMLARKHQLRVGQTGIVGFVTATGQPRIALDAGADAVFFDNPDLPNTHSEITLPLRYAGQVFGALDAQSDEPNAFSQEDIETLSTLADQVAAAIKNTLTLEEAYDAISKYKNFFNERSIEAWRTMQPTSVGLGFQMTSAAIQPLEEPLKGEHIKQAFAQNKPILKTERDGGATLLAIPIRLRGQTVGVVNLRTKNNYKLTNDDAEMAEAVTERLSFAIESATLLQSTQRRADIERLTAEISSKISSSTYFETILQTAAEELSKALSGSDVLVQIEPASLDMEI